MSDSHSIVEERRVTALEGLSILDSDRELTFDKITELVAQMLAVPHACVSLVHKKRVWFKSTFGVDAAEVPREPGFCSTLIEADSDHLYYEDASQHPVSRNNSLVCSAPSIRFYVGVPLTTPSGERIGTLCAFGPEPRKLADRELESLKKLGTLVMHEIDARKMRNRLDRTEAALRSSQRLDSLGLIASGVAHDFNNLLCAILGSVELLRDEVPPTTGVVELLGQIEETGRRASELAGQILAYAGGDAEPQTPVSLNDIVEQTYRMTRGAFENHARMESDMGDGTGQVLGQPTSLRQLVVNLLTNAAEACAPNQGIVHVRTQRSSDGKRAIMTVTDNGKGMSDELRARAFEPFYSTKTGGHGLGLSICKRIVEHHGGTIAIEAEAGVGTTVRVELPLTEGATPSAETNGHGTPETGTGEVVLVVDDEDAVRQLACTCIEKAGYSVVSAPGGAEAIRLLVADPEGFAAVVLDWSMPLVNGEQVLAAMAQKGIRVPVVLSSGHSERDARARSDANFAIAAFLKKPYTRRELVGAVATAVKNRARPE